MTDDASEKVENLMYAALRHAIDCNFAGIPRFHGDAEALPVMAAYFAAAE